MHIQLHLFTTQCAVKNTVLQPEINSEFNKYSMTSFSQN